MGAHRKSDQRRDDLYAGGLRKRATSSMTCGPRIICHAGAICRKWRTFLCYRTSDGIHIALQIARSLPPDLSHSVAKGVPSPARKSRSASTRHASRVRFVSPAFPLLRNLIVASKVYGSTSFCFAKLAIAAVCCGAGYKGVARVGSYGSRKSPAWSCVSITLPASS
jgi:hypothetical protein